MNTIQVKVKKVGADGKTIEIVTQDVQARRVGKYFAVHRNVKYQDVWSVTHIPSGAAVVPGVELRKQALEIAEALDNAVGVDWTKLELTDYTTAESSAAREALAQAGYGWLMRRPAEG